MILSTKLFILLRTSHFLIATLVNEQRNLIIPRQDGKLQSSQAIRCHEFIISSQLKQVSHYSDMIAFDCCNQRCFSSFCGLIDVRVAFLYEEGSGLQVSIVACAKKRSHLCVFRKFTVEQVGSLLDELFDVGVVFSIDVIEQVFTIGVSHCQALGCSHCQTIIIIKLLYLNRHKKRWWAILQQKQRKGITTKLQRDNLHFFPNYWSSSWARCDWPVIP